MSKYRWIKGFFCTGLVLACCWGADSAQAVPNEEITSTSDYRYQTEADLTKNLIAKKGVEKKAWQLGAAERRLSAGQPVEKRTLTILHVNDVHGSVDPGIDPKVDAKSVVGGLAWLASLIKQRRAQDPKTTLLLNGGDLAEGSMLSYMSRGVGYCKALHSLKFDAVALGNHDFAWGQQALADMMEALNSPIVAANIQHLSNGMPLKGTQPYRIIELDGVKVGILGLDTPDIKHFVAANKLEDLVFRKSAKTVKYYLPIMREAGADLVVVLSHIGYDNDLKLADKVPGIDLIVGAHSHTVLPEGHIVGKTLIAQAGFAAKYLGEIKLNLEGRPGHWRLVEAKSSLLPVICDQLQPDAEVEKILQPYRQEAKKIGEQIVAEATEDVMFYHREAGKLNQIHADSILEAAANRTDKQPGFDAPGQDKPIFGICNSRSLRGSLPKGRVTYRDVYSALPFTEENYVTMKVTGQMVIDEIEDDLRDKATELAVPCGLKYVYDKKRPEGSRLVKITLANGQSLDPQASYVIVSNETMSRKAAFKNAEDKRVLGPVQPIFFEAVKRLSPLSNNADDRVVCLP
ncbi:MAG: bifunctional metallophosphatase/5'-nucleotidase [Candidatus Bruticola sp.]